MCCSMTFATRIDAVIDSSICAQFPPMHVLMKQLPMSKSGAYTCFIHVTNEAMALPCQSANCYLGK